MDSKYKVNPISTTASLYSKMSQFNSRGYCKEDDTKPEVSFAEVLHELQVKTTTPQRQS